MHNNIDALIEQAVRDGKVVEVIDSLMRHVHNQKFPTKKGDNVAAWGLTYSALKVIKERIINIWS